MKRNIVAIVLFFISILIVAQQKPVITVLDFRTSGVSQSEMKSIISLISNTLFKTAKFTVIEVAQREATLKEIEFSMSDCVDETCQLQLGKQLSAELIVVGSIDKIGGSLVLASKVLETQSGRTASVADGMYRDLEELVRNIGNFGRELAGLPSTTDESIQVSGTTSASPEKTSRAAPPGFVLVEAGTFQMGSMRGFPSERPVHSVTIKRSFYMSQFEVTEKVWKDVLERNPRFTRSENSPVGYVTWFDAIDYCNKLSIKEGLTPCYSGSENNIQCDFSAGLQAAY